MKYVIVFLSGFLCNVAFAQNDDFTSVLKYGSGLEKNHTELSKQYSFDRLECGQTGVEVHYQSGNPFNPSGDEFIEFTIEYFANDVPAGIKILTNSIEKYNSAIDLGNKNQISYRKEVDEKNLNETLITENYTITIETVNDDYVNTVYIIRITIDNHEF